MKKNIILLVSILFLSLHSKGQDSYYFEGKGPFNPSIPTPESFFGFRIGHELVRYDKVVEYFRLLAEKSGRASFEVFGKSWENREQVKLFVTSPTNQQNLESIRQEHLKLIDPSTSLDLSNQKVIVELAYNVHGGEIAGTDAAILAAYYLVASESPDLIKNLEESVVLIEPSQNPDGRERAVNYINSFHAWPPVADPADIGHSAAFTPHRGNHYWNDLNRDWLPLSQIESKNRVAFYHKWYPNVYLDFHEMGSSSTYYFEPSPLSTWNKILPQSNYEVLNDILAKHFSAALNSIGSLYFTKESFTNLSPIYGSTYPDYQGGVGTTLEVGSTSGIIIETPAGIRTFSQNLRDNLLISIAAVQAAVEEKETFLRQQKQFFESALTQADQLPYKYIIFGSKDDNSLTNLFLDHLLRHQIQVYELASPFKQDNKSYETGSAYIVPVRQPQFRILQSIFEENETNHFNDSTTFYDISAWSTAHGYGIPFSKVQATIRPGKPINEVPTSSGSVSGRSSLAYAFDYKDYLAPKILYYLQDRGVKVRVSQRSFTSKTNTGEKEFGVGSIVIPVAYQTLSADELYNLLQEAVKLANISIHAITDGFSTAGIDLGSNNIRVLQKPTVAIIADGNWTSIGETWALLGNTHHIPLTKLTPQSAERSDLSRYSSIIINNGQLSSPLSKKITEWVENGGTLIALSAATPWASSLIITPSRTTEQRTLTNRDTTASQRNDNFPAGQRGSSGNASGRLNGVIVRAELNLSNPLAYGFSNKDFYSLKTSTSGLNVTGENVVLKTINGELVNGFAKPEGLSELKEKAIIATATRGRGSIVLFGESPTFRGYWLAPGRILTNAIFFGKLGNNTRFFSAEENE